MDDDAIEVAPSEETSRLGELLQDLGWPGKLRARRREGTDYIEAEQVLEIVEFLAEAESDDGT